MPHNPKRDVPAPKPVPCKYCHGTGRTPGNIECKACEGTGIHLGKKKEPIKKRNLFGDD